MGRRLPVLTGKEYEGEDAKSSRGRARVSDREKPATQVEASDKGSGAKGDKEAPKSREERLAEALRANLRRRKAAAKKA
ncbi:hypothetical protein [Roseibium sediminis]|uniref:hypothetical protein n=1 Tax=Roseibium sediminis TaxID=1775174 RepID=UPI00123DC5DD|nr:hypothetical protein [Roseibium sediminis]